MTAIITEHSTVKTKTASINTAQLASDLSPSYKADNCTSYDLNPDLAKLLGKVNTPTTIKIANQTIESKQPQDTETRPKQTVQFVPYSHPTPGKTQVHIRGKGYEESSFIQLEYNPDDIPIVDITNNPRSQIKLNGLDKEFVRQARLVVEEVKKEWAIANDLKKQYKAINNSYKEELKKSFKYKIDNSDQELTGKKKKFARYSSTEEKTALRKLASDKKKECEAHPLCNLYGKGKTVSLDPLKEVLRDKLRYLISEGRVDHNLEEDKAFETLTVYLCVKTKYNSRNGFIKELPHGFLNPEDESITEQLSTIGKYFIVNMTKNDTADKAEDFRDWAKSLSNAGLQKMGKLISPTELLKLCYPGYMDAPNPPIREGKISSPDKWTGDQNDSIKIKLMAKRTCQSVLIEEGVVNSDGSIDVEKFLEKDWGKIFYDPKYGLRGAIGICPFLPSTLSCIEIAAPGLIKRDDKEGVIPYWKFKYPNKFSGSTGAKLIDEITKYIVEEKLKLVDDKGAVSAERIRQVSDWAKQFDDECSGCLHRSGAGNAYEALKRVYPKLFGWNNNQVQPGEIRYSKMWHGYQGETLFRLRFAKSIHTVFEKLKEQEVEGFKNHTVKFNPNSMNTLEISKRDFMNLRNYYISKGITWVDHFTAFNLTAGFAEVAKNIPRAFALTLGPVDKATGKFGNTTINIEDVKDKNPTKTFLISNLLKDLDSPPKTHEVKINGLFLDYLPGNSTGIEGTCLEKYLIHRPQSDIYKTTDIFYKAFSAGILPSSKKDPYTKTNDRTTILEKILTATNPLSDNNNDYLITDEELRGLFKILDEEIIANVSINDEQKNNLKVIIKKLLSSKRSSIRETLTQAIETDKKYGTRGNNLGLLNTIIEDITEAIAIHEMRHERIHKTYSAHFDRIVGNLKIKEKDENEGEEQPTTIPEEQENITPTVNERDLLIEELSGGNEATKEKIYEELEELAMEEEILEVRSIAEKRGDQTGKRIDENENILRKLIDIALDSGKERTRLISKIIEGDIAVQVKILEQFRDRAKYSRSNGRFDYGSLRAKARISTKVDHLYRDNLENPTIDPLRIDSEIFTLIPEYWPHKEGTPQAIPLLYWNNTLHVAIPEDHDSAALKILSSNLKDISLETRTVSSQSWKELTQHYKKNYRISRIDPDKPRMNQFISKTEEDLMIENLALLRKAVKEIMNGK